MGIAHTSTGRRASLRRPVFALAASLCVFGTLSGGAVHAASVVTSVLGEALQGGAQLAIGDEIATDRALELPLGSRSSALIAGTAIVQLCEESKARFHDSAASSTPVVELERGALKAMVDGSTGDELVIRTPTAEASATGAAMVVEVDARTGTTTVASLERHVRVRAGAQGRTLVVGPGEQVVIASARPPSPVHRFDPSVLRSTHLCIDDEPFRREAASAASARQGRAAVDRIALADMPADPEGGEKHKATPWQAREAKSKQQRDARAEREMAFWGALQSGGAASPGGGSGSDPSGGGPGSGGTGTQPPVIPPSGGPAPPSTPIYDPTPAPVYDPAPAPVYEPEPLPPEPPPPVFEPCLTCGLVDALPRL